MSLLRIFIYIIGGFILTVLWIFSSFTFLPSSAQREISVIEMILVPGVGWLTLVAVDRWIHHLRFGTRNVVRLNAYRPCPVCPVSGKKGEVARNLTFSAHAIGPVTVTMKYSLPILISREAESLYPDQDISKLPGMMIARFTKSRATIYIKERDYQFQFASANQGALI